MKRRGGFVNIWNPFVLIAAGVLFALIGLILFLRERSHQKRYTGTATAKILSVARNSHYANGHARHIYVPTVAYTVDGNRYEAKGQGNGRSDYYVEGAEITVRYKPDRPEKCLTARAGDGAHSVNILLLIGAGFALLGVVAMLTTR